MREPYGRARAGQSTQVKAMNSHSAIVAAMSGIQMNTRYAIDGTLSSHPTPATSGGSDFFWMDWECRPTRGAVATLAMLPVLYHVMGEPLTVNCAPGVC